MIFQLFTPYKSIETQIWPFLKKGQPLIIIWTNLVELESSMLYTKIKPQSFLDSGEDFKEFFYDIRTWRPSCSVAWNYLYKLTISFRQKAMWNPMKIAQAVSEKKIFKFYTIVYMYIAQWQGQITLKGQNFDYN